MPFVWNACLTKQGSLGCHQPVCGHGFHVTCFQTYAPLPTQQAARRRTTRSSTAPVSCPTCRQAAERSLIKVHLVVVVVVVVVTNNDTTTTATNARLTTTERDLFLTERDDLRNANAHLTQERDMAITERDNLHTSI